MKEGSYVELDQPIYELETDKITQEGLADASGVINFLAQEGDEVEIGATIATIDESADAPSSPAVTEKTEETPTPVSTPDSKPEEPEASVLDEAKTVPVPSVEPAKARQDSGYSPAVRKLLSETGIDPSSVVGTGKDGRITKGDVLKAQQSTPAQKSAPVEAVAAPPQQAPAAPADGDRVTRRPLTPIRRKIASRLVEAQQTAAILSTFNEVDLSAVMALRKSHQDSFVKANGVKLGFMSFFVKAVVHALKAVPGINVRIEGDQLIEHHYYDIGWPWALKKGWLSLYSGTVTK